MKNFKEFNWITVLILSMVTCGIYSLYVFYKVAEDYNAEAEALGCKKVMGFIPAYLIGMVTCGIYLIFWFYQFATLQNELAQKKNVTITPTDNAIVYMILLFVPIYSYYVLCENYNRIGKA